MKNKTDSTKPGWVVIDPDKGSYARTAHINGASRRVAVTHIVNSSRPGWYAVFWKKEVNVNGTNYYRVFNTPHATADDVMRAFDALYPLIQS